MVTNDRPPAPDLEPIFKRLQAYYNLPEALDWMNSPHPQLDGQLPVAVIRSGQADRVHAILDRLDSDGYL